METEILCEKAPRKVYPSDVSDEEWAFVRPYLTLMSLDAEQRKYDLRDVFDAMRWVLRTGSPWRYLPGDFPRWRAVYDQTQRWIDAGCFEDILDDARELARVAQGKEAQPTVVIIDSQTLRSTVESGARAGYDGGKKTKGSKVHIAVDTLGNLLGLTVTPANVQERDEVGALTEQVQTVTAGNVQKAYADGACIGDKTAQVAKANRVELEIVKVSDTVRGFVILPKRWIVERSFAWKTRFRRLVRDYERLPETLAGLHIAVFAIITLARLVATRAAS